MKHKGELYHIIDKETASQEVKKGRLPCPEWWRCPPGDEVEDECRDGGEARVLLIGGNLRRSGNHQFN